MMLKQAFKYLGLSFFSYLIICLSTPFITLFKERSIENQINYLSELLEGGYDDVLQLRFPEGKLFSNALLALSIIDYSIFEIQHRDRYAAIVDQCINRIESPRAKENFNDNLNPEYGIFYSGWSNLVYSKYLDSELYAHSSIKEHVINVSSKIEEQIVMVQSDSLSLLKSYSEASWPADNLVGMSSVSKNASLKQKWLDLIFSTTDHHSGLIHHSGDDPTEIRGSSSAMITYFLSEIGYTDIETYSEMYDSLLVDDYLGIQLVKEHEDGSNDMDFDSGPVVFGYGASATIMNIKTQARLGNMNSKITWAAMNTLALPCNILSKKFYLSKQEPMLDLFMLWACVELLNGTTDE